MKTKVIFLIEKVDGSVFAYFPEMVHNFNGYRPDNMTCYSHIGQHSPCHPDYAKECKEAKFNEYSDLLKELIEQGYKNLEVMNKQETEIWRKPTPFELKQGYGAIHWLTVNLASLINRHGNLKKWVIAHDGLRYNR